MINKYGEEKTKAINQSKGQTLSNYIKRFGKIEGLKVSTSSHYFVKWNTATAKDNYLKLKFDLDNTVGARSLSKTEIIKQYYNTYIKKS